MLDKAEPSIRKAVEEWCLKVQDRQNVSEYIEVNHTADGVREALFKVYLRKNQVNNSLRFVIAQMSAYYIEGEQVTPERVAGGDYTQLMVDILKDQLPDVIAMESVQIRKLRDSLLAKGWKAIEEPFALSDLALDTMGHHKMCSFTTLFITSAQF